MLAVLATSLHVVLHDWDESGSGPTGHQECQLSHLTLALLPLPSLLILPFVLISLVVLNNKHFTSTFFNNFYQPRAPPFS